MIDLAVKIVKMNILKANLAFLAASASYLKDGRQDTLLMIA